MKLWSITKPKESREVIFKTICKRQGWNFDDFIEIDSGERYYTKDGRARDKKYYYFYKYK